MENSQAKNKKNSSVSTDYSVLVFIIVSIIIGSLYLFDKPFFHNLKQRFISSNNSFVAQAKEKPGFSNSESNNNIKGMKFIDTKYYANSYKIYPGSLDIQSKNAFAGWTMQVKSLSDSSASIIISPNTINGKSKAQKFIANKGDILYFIESNLKDDSVASGDANLRDDFGILVNSKGIVN